jgi:serine/threonine protein kinase
VKSRADSRCHLLSVFLLFNPLAFFSRWLPYSMLTGVVENIVDFKGYFYLQQKSKGKIKTVKNYHCIVMELMETNLEEIIHIKKEKLSDSTMRWLASDIAYGMSKIHSFDIIHRDIKPANILLNKIPDAPEGARQYIVKIADFGYARRDTNDSIRKSVVGTPAYLAPELIGQTKSFDVSRPTDVYSYGVVVWEMTTGKRPHDGLEVNSLYQSVFDAKKTGKPILLIPEKCDSSLKAIMERSLLSDPMKRPTFDDCYHALEKSFLGAPVK